MFSGRTLIRGDRAVTLGPVEHTIVRTLMEAEGPMAVAEISRAVYRTPRKVCNIISISSRMNRDKLCDIGLRIRNCVFHRAGTAEYVLVDMDDPEWMGRESRDANADQQGSVV